MGKEIQIRLVEQDGAFGINLNTNEWNRKRKAKSSGDYYLRISEKKSFIASQERRSAFSLYAAPSEGSLPDSELVKLCTAPP